MKRTDVVAFVAGVTFAIGLGISGMTQPAKVIAFLDVTGAWDPSLAFVMLGAIGVHLVFARRVHSAAAPRFAPAFSLPLTTGIDRRLLLGAALFVAGLLVGGLALLLFRPASFGVAPVSLPLAIVAGVFVGFGTRLGSGCTSGHGVCGISRFSGRSLAATMTFMATGALTAFVVQHLVGGAR